MKKSISYPLIITLLIVYLVSIGAIKARYSYNPAIAHNVPSRALNTPFMISDQRDAIVSYHGLITVTATLLAGTSGQIILQRKTGAGAWTSISTGQLTVSSGLVYNGSATVSVFGAVTKKDSVRIITNNLVGTPTYGSVQGMEILTN